MSNLKRVVDRLVELMPKLETRPGHYVAAHRLVQEWLDAGCDVDLDILPAINKTFAHMRGPATTPGYFDKPVRQAREKRVGSIEHLKRQDDQRADAIRFSMKIGRYVPTYDEAFLAEYESRSKMVLDSTK